MCFAKDVLCACILSCARDQLVCLPFRTREMAYCLNYNDWRHWSLEINITQNRRLLARQPDVK